MALALAIGGVLAGWGVRAEPPGRTRAPHDGGHARARNVILLIGDGMGDAEITLARYYAMGAHGRLSLDTLPHTGTLTTSSVYEAVPHLPNYVPDSAATATAWSTGAKTSNGRISTTAGGDVDLPTILETAGALGYRTGLVTTTELTDATPAAMAAHVAHRECQGPADMSVCPQDRPANGGPGSIAEQMVSHDIQVLLGGGATRFEQHTDAGPIVLADAEARGYRIVRTARELDAAAPGDRLLGLFTPGNLSTEWTGAPAAPYPSNVHRPQRCRPEDRGSDEPTLEQMTAAALRLLARDGNEPGFFLQVEGGSIDKQDHEADPCGQIGETLGFDAAVRLAVDFASRQPETLVIVTADHAHTSQIVATPTDLDHPPGLISVLLTSEGAPLTVSYGTNLPGRQQGHTGTQIRVAAFGPGSAAVMGVHDQTDLFHWLSRAVGAPGAGGPPVPTHASR